MVASPSDIPAALSVLARISVGEVQVDEPARSLTAAVTGGVDTLRHVLQSLAEAEVTVVDVGLRRPTLDDVFLTLTGHAAQEVEESTEGDAIEAERPSGEVREKEGVR